MSIVTQHDFSAAKVVRYMEDLFGHHDIGNGTSAGMALATALLVDARSAGRKVDDILDLQVADLEKAAGQLAVALREGRHDFELPFGTETRSRDAGSVQVASCTYVLDAGRPGLHPMLETRRDAHGPNLDLLRRLIRRGTRSLACRRIGLPASRTIVINDERNLIQYPPFPDAADVVLQRSTCDCGADRFCAATSKQIKALADSMIEDMRVLWKRRREIAARVQEVRLAAEAGILAEGGADIDLRVSAVTLDLSRQREDAQFCCYVEYEGIDEAWRRGITLEFAPGCDDLTRFPLHRIPRSQRYRAADRAELHSVGAQGRIEAIAFAIASSAPEGANAVLARLKDRTDLRGIRKRHGSGGAGRDRVRASGGSMERRVGGGRRGPAQQLVQVDPDSPVRERGHPRDADREAIGRGVRLLTDHARCRLWARHDGGGRALERNATSGFGLARVRYRQTCITGLIVTNRVPCDDACPSSPAPRSHRQTF